MKRYTVKDLRREIDFVNEYTIAGTEYKIKIVPQYGAYYLYQKRKDETTRTMRLLFVGTAKECSFYLSGLKAAYYYFSEDND